MNGDRTRVNVHAGNGHCIIGGYTGDTQNLVMMSSSPEAAEYFKEHLPELHQRLGPARGRQGAMGIATIFPNFTWFGISGHLVRMWHPRGPLKTEAWTYCVVDKKAPQSVKDGIRKRLTLAFSPSGTFEQDDMDNFGQSTASGRFMQGRNVPVNVSQGIGHTWTHEAIPGLLSPSVSEENARFLLTLGRGDGRIKLERHQYRAENSLLLADRYVQSLPLELGFSLLRRRWGTKRRGKCNPKSVTRRKKS